MTDTTNNLDLLRRLDPLDMSTTAELDPTGATARRVHAAAIAAAQQPGPITHAPTATNRAPRRAPRIALAATGIAALAAVALAIGLPGGGNDSSTAPGPAEARAALVAAAERTSAFTSGHLVWTMAYVYPRFDMDIVLTNDVRYEGSDLDITLRSDGVDTPAPENRTNNIRIIGSKSYWREGDRPYRVRDNPHGDGIKELMVRVQAADALAAAARTAADVRQTTLGDGTRFTATVPAADVPEQFRPPFKRTVDTVAITADVGENGAIRSLALRAPGEAVDVTFSEMGEPQGIVAP